MEYMGRLVKLFTLFLAFSLFNLGFVDHVKAFSEINLPQEQVNPGSFRYSLKRVWEKVRETFTFSSQAKVGIYDQLTQKRFLELNYVTDKKMLGEVEKASERLSFYAGKLVEEEMKDGNKDKYKEIFEKFDRYIRDLEIMRDRFSANSSYWMLVQYSIDSLKSLQIKLK